MLSPIFSVPTMATQLIEDAFHHLGLTGKYSHFQFVVKDCHCSKVASKFAKVAVFYNF